MRNPITGVQITESDLLLVIGDQTVTIAVLRQQVSDARAETAAVTAQFEQVIKKFKAELDDARRPKSVPPGGMVPDSPFNYVDDNRAETPRVHAPDAPEYAPGLGAIQPNAGEPA